MSFNTSQRGLSRGARARTCAIHKQPAPMRGDIAKYDGEPACTEVAATNSRLDRISSLAAFAKASNFDPATFAARASISLRQLERITHFRYGQCPRAWLMQLRCQEAKGLIEMGYSNKAVAADLDFSSESHLCHAFKRVFGRPPQSFAPIAAPPPASSAERLIVGNLPSVWRTDL
jgi:AraC-like DNA-binding protein